MNIREHIEAGHYPKDGKGRALVPMRNGRTATILETDRDEEIPGREPIVGLVSGTGGTSSWWPSGEEVLGASSDYDLLPPTVEQQTDQMEDAIAADGVSLSAAVEWLKFEIERKHGWRSAFDISRMKVIHDALSKLAPKTKIVDVWRIEYAWKAPDGWKACIYQGEDEATMLRYASDIRRQPHTYACVKMTGPHKQEKPC